MSSLRRILAPGLLVVLAGLGIWALAAILGTGAIALRAAHRREAWIAEIRHWFRI